MAFPVMINDAAITTERLKYVDDLTVFQACSVNRINEETELQQVTDQLSEWAQKNKMVLNAENVRSCILLQQRSPL